MFSSKLRISKSSSRHCLIVLALISVIQLSSIECQDFADLNKQQQQHTFQQLNRQANQANAAVQTSQSKHFMQRPVLSSRFAPTGNGNQQQQQQPLAAQASFSASVFSAPPSGSPVASNGQQQQQIGTIGAQQPTSQAGVSNIEQLMKNALARTAQMNSAAAEPRQDLAPAPQSAPAVDQALGAAAIVASTRIAEAEPDAASKDQLTGDGDESKLTTVATTTSGHDTVYSDQRFANLFARRGSNKKSRITPTEQVKAKPTLPSFIKSPPDPKQFTSAQQAESQDRPVTQSPFASQRLQQQNQARGVNSANQQKKAVINSNSAANANNKRTNSLNSNKQPQTPPKVGAAISKAVTNKPSAAAINNPFSRPQNSNSDPANVIAMARKRLLANNAIESAKLKQQQQNKPTN